MEFGLGVDWEWSLDWGRVGGGEWYGEWVGGGLRVESELGVESGLGVSWGWVGSGLEKCGGGDDVRPPRVHGMSVTDAEDRGDSSTGTTQDEDGVHSRVGCRREESTKRLLWSATQRPYEVR